MSSRRALEHTQAHDVSQHRADIGAPSQTGFCRAEHSLVARRIAILIPPLRERREAIPAFVAHLIEHFNRLFGKDVKFVSRSAIDAMCANQWLGNVREPGHMIESAVLMTDGDRIDVDDLLHRDNAAGEATDQCELRGLADYGGRPRAIAIVRGELLGVSRYKVYRMLNRFGLGERLTYRTSRKPTEVLAQ